MTNEQKINPHIHAVSNPELEALIRKGAYPKQGKNDILATSEMVQFTKSLTDIDGTEDISDLLVDKQLLSIHGLLSPMGKLYSCKHGQHTQLTKILGYKNQYELENDGWISLSGLQWRVQPRFTQRKPTGDQWRVIQQWYLNNGYGRGLFLDLQEEARS